MESAKKVIDKNQALKKAEHYCAYQERSQQEVREKLYSFNLYSKEVEDIISQLIQNNFLNEERFAIAFALGKFRIKHWGRIKIRQSLKLKRVSEALIRKAINQIDAEDYYATLQKLIAKKNDVLNEKNSFKRKNKLILYALSRGFERDLIMDILKDNQLG